MLPVRIVEGRQGCQDDPVDRFCCTPDGRGQRRSFPFESGEPHISAFDHEIKTEMRIDVREDGRRCCGNFRSDAVPVEDKDIHSTSPATV